MKYVNSGNGRTLDEKRTERDVLNDLSPVEQELLKRVLEIERARLHAKDAELTDEILSAVKGIVQ